MLHALPESRKSIIPHISAIIIRRMVAGADNTKPSDTKPSIVEMVNNGEHNIDNISRELDIPYEKALREIRRLIGQGHFKGAVINHATHEIVFPQNPNATARVVHTTFSTTSGNSGNVDFDFAAFHDQVNDMIENMRKNMDEMQANMMKSFEWNDVAVQTEVTATKQTNAPEQPAQPQVARCKYCGANNQVVGPVNACEYCGSPL